MLSVEGKCSGTTDEHDERACVCMRARVRAGPQNTQLMGEQTGKTPEMSHRVTAGTPASELLDVTMEAFTFLLVFKKILYVPCTFSLCCVKNSSCRRD